MRHGTLGVPKRAPGFWHILIDRILAHAGTVAVAEEPVRERTCKVGRTRQPLVGGSTHYRWVDVATVGDVGDGVEGFHSLNNSDEALEMTTARVDRIRESSIAEEHPAMCGQRGTRRAARGSSSSGIPPRLRIAPRQGWFHGFCSPPDGLPRLRSGPSGRGVCWTSLGHKRHDYLGPPRNPRNRQITNTFKMQHRSCTKAGTAVRVQHEGFAPRLGLGARCRRGLLQ